MAQRVTQNQACLRRRRRQWHPTPLLLPGKSHGWWSLVGCSPWGFEESDMIERLHFHFSLSCVGEGNGSPLHYSCLENPRDGRAWWAAVYGFAQSWTQLKRLSSSSSSRYLREELSQRTWEQGSVAGKSVGSCLVTKSGNMIPLALFFLKIVLAIWSLLCFHTNFRILCNCSVKSAFGILIQIALKLQIALGNMVIFSSVQFSHSVVTNSLCPHGLQHARLPCLSPTP